MMPGLTLSADDVIARLNLMPHPEGGHYREIYRAGGDGGVRSAVTSIYYLLCAGEYSAWHRIDASEVWNFHAGAPLLLRLRSGEHVTSHILGTDLALGQRPQAVVPPFCWQSAQSQGLWTLVGCTVAPGFEFSGFELA